MISQQRVIALMLPVLCLGCTTNRKPSMDPAVTNTQLKMSAIKYLKAGLAYPHNPVVRAEAVEALRDVTDPEARSWLRSALLDDHPAVRFAACLAVGELRDRESLPTLRSLKNDQDANVRVGAIFALHRLGIADQTGSLPTYLFYDDDPTVRRNTAMVFGLLGEASAIKVLARSMRDRDLGVRNYALEAMAKLGNPEAIRDLVFMTNSGVGADEVFALNALAATEDRNHADTFRYKFSSDGHTETKLAAAFGLAILGAEDGVSFAMQSLRHPGKGVESKRDSRSGRELRVRLLALRVLRALGENAAIQEIKRLMENSSDPRLQVAAASAVFAMAEANKRKVLSTLSGSRGVTK